MLIRLPHDVKKTCWKITLIEALFNANIPDLWKMSKGFKQETQKTNRSNSKCVQIRVKGPLL